MLEVYIYMCNYSHWHCTFGSRQRSWDMCATVSHLDSDLLPLCQLRYSWQVGVSAGTVTQQTRPQK